MTGPDRHDLSTYLDDGLAGATVALHRVRRSARSAPLVRLRPVVAPA